MDILIGVLGGVVFFIFILFMYAVLKAASDADDEAGNG